MTPADKKYYFNLIKGRIAENITEEMFRKLGFYIEKFGFENQLPRMSAFLRNFKNTDTVDQLRHMPDFVLFKEKKEPQFIEVKFRHNKTLSKSDIVKYTPYPNTIFIVYDNENIHCFRHCGESSDFINDLPLLKDDADFSFSDAEKQIIDSFCSVFKLFYKDLPKSLE